MAPSLKALRQSGIAIDEHCINEQRSKELPSHVQELRGLLLNFEGIVPLSKKPKLESLCIGGSPISDKIYCDSGHQSYRARWAAAVQLRDKANTLEARQMENKWRGLMANFVFEGINEQASEGSDELFTNAVSIRGNLSDQNSHQPKPDFWFGLRLYSEKQLSRLKGLERKDEGIEYFTPEWLATLSESHRDPFIYRPVKSMEYEAFPWMVVELKKELENEPEGEQKCLSQAANASHTCLKLIEQLETALAIQNASSIVAFTAVGPRAKLFLTYRCEESKGIIYRMSCIWDGNLRNMLHAIELRRIVDQLMFWAMRIFKPWVTDCLDQWYKGGEINDKSDRSHCPMCQGPIMSTEKKKPAHSANEGPSETRQSGTIKRLTGDHGVKRTKPKPIKTSNVAQPSGTTKSKHTEPNSAISDKFQRFIPRRFKKAKSKAAREEDNSDHDVPADVESGGDSEHDDSKRNDWEQDDPERNSWECDDSE